MDNPSVDTVSACVKCGLDWSENEDSWPGIEYTPNRVVVNVGSQREDGVEWRGGEALIRTCIRCGYSWTEAPLDAKS